jgi:predicted  nucleic acid-binding Zn-ribbon protein
LESGEKGHEARLKEILTAYNEAWTKYWDSYIKLQDQLYESLRAGREVSWLAATDERKLSEINQVQRSLFESMPRRLDYSPLGQITHDMSSAPNKIKNLEAALVKADDGCRSLEAAIALMKEKVEAMKEAISAAGS